MKAGLTEIVMIVDRSGSMRDKMFGAIEGFNAFVQQQAAEPGEALLTVVLFDHERQLFVERTPIGDVDKLSEETYVPRGDTALNDAVGIWIKEVGDRLSATAEEERPSKVIFAILTDGMENASREFSQAEVGEMIKHQQDVYGWDFLFLASELQALASASAMNVPVSNQVAFAASSIGTQTAFESMSNETRRLRNP